MTGEQLFESLQYLDNDLLASSPPRAARPGRWLTWAAAACLALAILIPAFLNGPKPADPGAHLDTPEAGAVKGAGEKTDINMSTRPIQPAGVPGPEASTPAPERVALAWNELEHPATEIGGVVMVGDPLTQEELAACCPEIRLEWMAQVEGYASYYLIDGSGGLAFVTLRYTAPEGADTITLELWDADPPPHYDVVIPRETDRVGALNGQAYRAYRCAWTETDGPPWVELSVCFEKEHVAYALRCSVPRTEEDAAAHDLTDLLLAYAGTHSVPDLSLFRYRGSLSTPAEP